MPTLAHVTGGRGDLPLPSWLFVWGAVVAVALTAVALRTSWPRPRLAAAAESRDLPEAGQRARPALTITLRAIGLFVHGVLLVAGLAGAGEANAVNLAPVGVFVGLWLVVQVVAAVGGDVWRALDPFDTLARLVFGRGLPESTGRVAPAWTAAVMLASLAWLELCYHSPRSPRPIGIWLLAYTVAALAGARVWGRAWLRTGEGFGAFFGLVGRMGFVRYDDGRRRLGLRPPIAGLAAPPAPTTGALAVVLVALGAAVFDAVSALDAWRGDVLDGRTGWSQTLVQSMGLVFTIAAVALLWIGVARVAARLAGKSVGDDLAVALATALVPIAVAWLIAHDVGLLFVDVQSIVAIASDPFGQGWDLFGTIDNGYWFPSVALIAWVQAAALVAGHVAATVVVHDVLVERHRLRAAVRSSSPVLVLVAVSAAWAMWLLLGV